MIALRSSLARRVRATLAPAVVALLAACERAPRPEEAQSPPPAGDTTPASASTQPTGWRADAGPVLLVAWPSPHEASVVSPAAQGDVDAGVDVGDPDAFARASFTLVDRAGRRHEARFGGWISEPEYSGCSPWPVVQLVDASGRSPEWTVGLSGAAPRAIPLDSLAGIGTRDSARLVAEVARLASMVRRPANPAFHALPYVVQQVHRFQPAPGTQALAATVVRRMAQEATPLEERTFLVAERDSGGSAYHLVYDERVAAPEETIESVEVLAAIRTAPGAPLALVLARDYGTTRGFAMLEREGPKRWVVRWTSARMRCG